MELLKLVIICLLSLALVSIYLWKSKGFIGNNVNIEKNVITSHHKFLGYKKKEIISRKLRLQYG